MVKLTRRQRLAAFEAYRKMPTMLKFQVPTDEQLEDFDRIVNAALDEPR